mmetsp:Transcript_7334/g.18030  ORF Transcript_7334/g.18030 Transcript_7334/m.18030 type:complete len:209 (-) Transcript_7334:1100-1726(-)
MTPRITSRILNAVSFLVRDGRSSESYRCRSCRFIMTIATQYAASKAITQVAIAGKYISSSFVLHKLVRRNGWTSRDAATRPLAATMPTSQRTQACGLRWSTEKTRKIGGAPRQRFWTTANARSCQLTNTIWGQLPFKANDSAVYKQMQQPYIPRPDSSHVSLCSQWGDADIPTIPRNRDTPSQAINATAPAAQNVDTHKLPMWHRSTT